MPRPNQPRSIASEQALARRVAYEREKRGMSYEGLASRMTKVGCPIQASGLYKVEKAGRRITVDELVALAEVFGLEVNELLRPVEMILHADIARVEEEESQAWRAMNDAIQRVVETRDARAELYRKAAEGGDAELSAAVEAFWEERERRMREQAGKGRGGGLAKILAQFEAEQAEWTDEQRAKNERDRKIEEAVDVLVDAIYKNTDEILGDS